MKPEVKAQWLAALRSGDYAKGIGHLHSVSKTPEGEKKHEFCCLGVLCELAIANGVPLERSSVERESPHIFYGPTDQDRLRDEGEDDAFLPQIVREWAGVNSGDLTVLIPDGLNGALRRTTISTVNDDEFDAFPPIADILENFLFEDNDPVNPETPDVA